MSTNSLILVIIQLSTMFLLLVLDNPVTEGLGLLIQFFGALIGVWAIATVKIGNFNIQPEVKSDSLISVGPYRWVRNPMYLAVILFFLPIVVKHFDWIKLITFLILSITLLFKILREEKFLHQKFQDEYMNYKKHTWRLFPYIF